MRGVTPDPVGEVADDLAAVIALREVADRLEDAAVQRAISAGWSWSQVAQALGVTRQAVHKKHLRRLGLSGLGHRSRRD
ncbi:MAG TPA: helix-turn-helix domain-containing protein [Nakamurella sp.]|jgi:transcriptional regulator of acetoin/glycerol metabolism|nr:helix-turn-helix domain-containing protein [Nakamurella sp.]